MKKLILLIALVLNLVAVQNAESNDSSPMDEFRELRENLKKELESYLDSPGFEALLDGMDQGQKELNLFLEDMKDLAEKFKEKLEEHGGEPDSSVKEAPKPEQI